jgi:hypothetical protein
MSNDQVDPKQRAIDVLLGGLGYGEDATILNVKRLNVGYSGEGQFSDGEKFEFNSEDPLTDLEDWALNLLLGVSK